MTHEEYVRSVWEGIVTSGFNWPNNGKAGVSLARHNQPVFSRATWPEAWSAAAEFTRDRLEQVRQLRSEVVRNSQRIDALHRELGHAIKEGLAALARVAASDICTDSRTLARLESALATLTQGMNPDVQP